MAAADGINPGAPLPTDAAGVNRLVTEQPPAVIRDLVELERSMTLCTNLREPPLGGLLTVGAHYPSTVLPDFVPDLRPRHGSIALRPQTMTL